MSEFGEAALRLVGASLDAGRSEHGAVARLLMAAVMCFCFSFGNGVVERGPPDKMLAQAGPRLGNPHSKLPAATFSHA